MSDRNKPMTLRQRRVLMHTITAVLKASAPPFPFGDVAKEMWTARVAEALFLALVDKSGKI